MKGKKKQTWQPPLHPVPKIYDFLWGLLKFVCPLRCLFEWCEQVGLCFLHCSDITASPAQCEARLWRSCKPTEIPITAHCIMMPDGAAVAERRRGWKTCKFSPVILAPSSWLLWPLPVQFEWPDTDDEVCFFYGPVNSQTEQNRLHCAWFIERTG